MFRHRELVQEDVQHSTSSKTNVLLLKGREQMLQELLMRPVSVVIDQGQYAAFASVDTTDDLIPFVCSRHRQNVNLGPISKRLYAISANKLCNSGFLCLGSDDDDLPGIVLEDTTDTSFKDFLVPNGWDDDADV